MPLPSSVGAKGEPGARRVNARRRPAPHSFARQMLTRCPLELSFGGTVVNGAGTALGPGGLALREKTGTEEASDATDMAISLSEPLQQNAVGQVADSQQKFIPHTSMVQGQGAGSFGAR